MHLSTLVSCGGQCGVQCPGSCSRQLLQTGSCMHLHPSQPADVGEPRHVCGGGCGCPAGARCAVCRHHQHGRLRHQPSHTLWCAPERWLRDWCGIDQGIHQPGMRCARVLGCLSQSASTQSHAGAMARAVRMPPCHPAALRVAPRVVLSLHFTQPKCTHTHNSPANAHPQHTCQHTHTHMFRLSASP